ncbi:Gag polyprotein [Operophtera brumata]|uniref:Gag polyprotein n=1 Tax=Operophtera brumata TaxID=104452 RepID=A0A0L7LCJ2_OPEBR|nr:Gag polyprotein [Operophtera brumata]
MATIRFGLLRKQEVEYEITVRGEDPLATVADQRKQIDKLFKLYPHDSIEESPIHENIDYAAANATLTDLLSLSLNSSSDLDRAATFCTHLGYRLGRITPSTTSLKERIARDLVEVERMTAKVNTLKSKATATPTVEKANPFEKLLESQPWKLGATTSQTLPDTLPLEIEPTLSTPHQIGDPALSVQLGRITPSTTSLKERIARDLVEVERMTAKVNTLKSKATASPTVEKANPFEKLLESQPLRLGATTSQNLPDTLPLEIEPTLSTPHQIGDPALSVQCADTKYINDLHKLRYDGTTCVRSFLLRLEEFRLARGISKPKLLNSAYEILTGNTLHWLRHVRPSINTWDELTDRLKEDFDADDFDYMLMTEIRDRTQGDSENIMIYISILSEMIGQLKKQPPAEEVFEIVLHNIRPCYAEVLAVTGVKNLDELITACKNYEKFKSRTKFYHEPPRTNTHTLAPDYAYKGKPTVANLPAKQNYGSNPGTSRYINNYSQRYENRRSNVGKPSAPQQVAPVAAIDAVERSTPGPSAPKNKADTGKYCPRCRRNNHSLNECRQSRFIICFRCGTKDYKTPDCPNCNKPKN